MGEGMGMERVPAALLFAPTLVDSQVTLGLTRREQAWLEELRHWGTLEARKARALVRTVPPRLRELAWRQICGSIQLELANADLYARYSLTETPFEDIIEKDTRRTQLPNSGPGGRERWEAALRRVLRAFAVQNPDVGYTQGMSSCCLLLLRVTRCAENEAFWMLSQIVGQHALAGLWQDNLPLLKLLLYAVDRLLEMRLPRLFAHFKALGVTPLLYSSQWFTGAFAYGLPFALSVRIWDVFLAEGTTWLLKVALAILRLHQDRLLTFQTIEPLVEYLKQAPAAVDPDALVRSADELSFVTAELVCQLKGEFNHPSMSSARSFF